MLFRTGAGSLGYNELPEYFDMDCAVSIPASTTLLVGQVVWYNQSSIPPAPPTPPTVGVGADNVVLPPNAAALIPYGVYQGPAAIVNPSATAALLVGIMVRKMGYGKLLAQVTASGTGSSAVDVGSSMIGAPNTAGLIGSYAGAAALGTSIGYALATGSVTSPGGQLMAASTAATLLINAYILLR